MQHRLTSISYKRFTIRPQNNNKAADCNPINILHTEECRKQKSRCRSQWPRGLRRWVSAARLLGLRVRIPPGACVSVVSVVCCQVEVCETGWSLVQRSHTECGVSVTVKPRLWPTGGAVASWGMSVSESGSHSTRNGGIQWELPESGIKTIRHHPRQILVPADPYW